MPETPIEEPTLCATCWSNAQWRYCNDPSKTRDEHYNDLVDETQHKFPVLRKEITNA